MELAHHGLTLLQRLNAQREFGFLCDCTIVIGDVFFKAHKAVLAAFSNYFRMLFVHQDSECVRLKPADIQPEIFSYLLNLMYTGKLTPQFIDPLRLEQGVKFLHAYPLLQEASLEVPPSTLSPVLANSLFGIQISEHLSSNCLPNKRKRPSSPPPPTQSPAREPKREHAVEVSVAESPQRPAESMVSCSPTAPSTGPQQRLLPIGLLHRNASRRKHHTCSYCGCLFTQRSQLREHMVLHCQQVRQLNLTTHSSQQGEQVSLQPWEQSGTRTEEATPDSFHVEPPAEGEMPRIDSDFMNSDGELPIRLVQPTGDSTPPPSDIADIDRLEDGPRADTGETKRRRFQCPTCGRKFLQRSHWREHMYTHTGKPYRCSACHKTFCRASQAARHTCRQLTADAYTMVDPQSLLLCDGVDGSQTEALFLPSSRPYKCHTCTLPFSSPAEVFKHHCSQPVRAEGFVLPQDTALSSGSRDTSPVLGDGDES